jgi:geranyl-CoA carboxylase beta subunit
VVQRLHWKRGWHAGRPRASGAAAALRRRGTAGHHVPADKRKPVDMREVIARIVDDSDFLEFKAPTTAGHRAATRSRAWPMGIITNNGPIDPDGATKATHFIQACCQSGTPLLYLQNTTGYMVGKAYESAGMIKHGSKMIQAVANATVPQITRDVRRLVRRRQLRHVRARLRAALLFSWPNAAPR